jgi:hypothetical protein
MDALHEAVEVDSALGFEWRQAEELVHEEALASPDRAPQVDAAYRAPAPEQPVEHAAIVAQFLGQALEGQGYALLRRVQLEPMLRGYAPELI